MTQDEMVLKVSRLYEEKWGLSDTWLARAAIALVLEEAARVAVTPCPVVPHPRECQRCANSKLKYKSPRDAAAAIRQRVNANAPR